MSAVWSIAKKELRSFFKSPVALIFLGVFYLATYFAFFTWDRFFARNLADVRPLFEWLPLLLIFLVGAVTMRAWSEESKMGTLEVLMTLPIKTWQLVAGKFAAGMLLIAVALLPTLSLPITVATIGDLDWGPVTGGYVAAFLLASTYMAIGLCVSARSQNQIVSLMMTVVLCGALYLVGSPGVVGLVSTETGELLRTIGSGARFESIERGVLDARDLVYYLSLTAFFLTLNHVFLALQRTDDGPKGRPRRVSQWVTAALVLVNAIALNVWMQPVTEARADLTENGDYTLEDVSIELVRNLDEPMVITGYFSEKTHPKLAPLVPRLKDLLTEYEIESQGRATVEFVDPSSDEDLEARIDDEFGIRSFAVSVAERNEQSVVNSYFHVLVQYGDQHQVLGFDELIDIIPEGDDVTVRLRNPELAVTRAARRATQDFLSIESVLASLDGTATLTAYLTPETMPESLEALPDRVRTVARELVDKSDGRLVFEEAPIPTSPAEQRRLAETRGVAPMMMFAGESFYSYVVFEYDGVIEPYPLLSDIGESELRETLESAVMRASSSYRRTIGLVTEAPEQPQMPGHMGMMAPPRQKYRNLEQVLSDAYDVERLDLADGVVPGRVDTLIVAQAGDLDEKQQFAIDQYLMRGGTVVVLAGKYDATMSRISLSTEATDDGLLDLLEHYGVAVEDALVLDPQNATFAVPAGRQRHAFVPYPFFPDVRRDGFDDTHLALGGLDNVVLAWASPLTVTEPEGVESSAMLKSSADSWTRAGGSLELDFAKIREHQDTGGLTPGDADVASRTMAVSLTGDFASYFADRANPMVEPGDDATSDDEKATHAEDVPQGLLERAVPGARLVVIGSSMFVSDEVLGLGMQLEPQRYQGNLRLMHNLVEWAAEDTDLLALAGSSAFARTLDPVDDDEQLELELMNYGVAGVMLLALAFVAWDRNPRPLPIRPRQRRDSRSERARREDEPDAEDRDEPEGNAPGSGTAAGARVARADDDPDTATADGSDSSEGSTAKVDDDSSEAAVVDDPALTTTECRTDDGEGADDDSPHAVPDPTPPDHDTREEPATAESDAEEDDR